MKIEIDEDPIEEQVDEKNLEADKAQDDNYLSHSFSKFVSDSKVKTTQINSETNHHGSKSNQRSINDFTDITLFKHHSFVKIEKLSLKQILDWTQKKQSSLNPVNNVIRKPAINNKIGSKKIEMNALKSYGCSYCDKKFPKAHFAKIHERIHIGEKSCEKRYSCKYCGKKFTQSGSVKVHEGNCGEKSFVFEGFEMSKHQKSIKIQENSNKADQSKSLVNMNDTESSNTEDITELNPVSYQEAVKYFEGNKNPDDKIEPTNVHEDVAVNLNKSPITKNSNGMFCCRFCDKTFTLKPSVTRHEKTHTKENGKYRCKFCDKKFTKSGSAKRHEKTCAHTDIVMSVNVKANENFETFKEPEMSSEVKDNFKYDQENSLGLMVDIDNTESSIENTEDISVENPKENSVEDPVSVQEAVKYFEGNKNLDDNDELTNLYEDITVNLNKAPITKNSNGKFCCRFCDKTFTQKPSVTRHERTHTGEKPFACRYCQYKTANSGNLKKHEKTHKINTNGNNDSNANARMYSDEPKRAIKTKNNHMTEENGGSKQEKDSHFKCEVCLDFVQNESRQQHIVQCKLYKKFVRKTTKGYKCHICSKELSGKVAMLHHLKSSHPNVAKFFQPPKINKTRQTNYESAEVGSSPESNADTFSLSEKGLDLSVKSQMVNVKQEILQQNFENVLSSDQIWNSLNIDSNVQKDILGKLSLLEPVAFEKTEVLNKIEEFPKASIGNGVQQANFELPDGQSSFSKRVPNQKDDKEQTNIKKRHGCRFCEVTFTLKESARRHEKRSCKKFQNKAKIPDQTNSQNYSNIGSFDCKYCDKKFTQKGSAKRHEKTYHTKGGSIKKQQESSQHDNASSENMGNIFSSESEESSLSRSFQSFVTKYQQEIPQQEISIKEEIGQMNDQICNSSKDEVKDNSNIDSNFQNVILGHLSILEPVPFEKSKENNKSDFDSNVSKAIFTQLSKLEPVGFEKSKELKRKSTDELSRMDDHVLKSSKHNESNDQKAIFESLSKLEPVVFGKSKEPNTEELNKKNNDEKPFGCEYCEKRFAQANYAKIHERIHTGEKPFACNICDYKSTNSGNLMKHVKIHGITNDIDITTSKKAVKPKVHEKEVRTPDQTNTPIDSKDRKYACKYCDKKFTKSHSVKIHERIHTGEKPYGCQYCEKKFTQSQTAKAHERSHTAEKPYACKYCDKKFTQSQTLKKHELTHKQENMELNPING